jgi:hypothetical protein
MYTLSALTARRSFAVSCFVQVKESRCQVANCVVMFASMLCIMLVLVGFAALFIPAKTSAEVSQGLPVRWAPSISTQNKPKRDGMFEK